MYTFSIKELEDLVAVGRCAGLWGMNLVAENFPRAQRICNGIGAGWMKPWMRKLIGIICVHLVAISLPHDIEYQDGGGIWERWVADWHFLVNGLRMAWDVFKRYIRSKTKKEAIKETAIVAAQAIALWLLLRIGGMAAFNWHKKRKGAK